MAAWTAASAAALLAAIIVALQLPAADTIGGVEVQRKAMWEKMDWGCISETYAVQREEAASESHCAMQAFGIGGDLVAQWNSETGACCVFRYQEVCRLPSAADGAGPSDTCLVFGRFVAIRKQLGDKLAAAWLFGISGDVNLVCGINDESVNKNLWQASGVTWSNEGVTFAGSTSSRMVTQDSDLANFGEGLTWLLRMKRQPQVQIYIEAVSCANSNRMLDEIWEWSAPNKPHYQSPSGLSPFKRFYYTPLLPNDANAWVNLAVSVSPSNGTMRLFVGDGLVPDTERTSVGGFTSPTAAAEPWCFVMGHNPRYNGPFKGTVAGLGIARAAMTVAEIRNFFSQLM